MAKNFTGGSIFFLLESGETVERRRRFSVAAWDPPRRLRLCPDRAELACPGGDDLPPPKGFLRPG
jgi:hypothetical protein